ncbi:MAG: hypothetical protein KBA28_04110 [Syntrophaceae bacterium]|jgi:serine kinase of HPr protein (carbohydrate metabolism regulator)|nr:hypothetical protein [Syntrophaceae bacterium]HOC58826.1 hypothetical protein [Smithellaceae bacterium]HQM45844.1 hypothetical protein [Smithellaceae bacterium]
MSHVPRKTNTSLNKVSLDDVFENRFSFLEIGEKNDSRGWKKKFSGFSVTRAANLKIALRREGEILIFSDAATKKLEALGRDLRQQYFASLDAGKAALLMFSQREKLPLSLKKQISSHHLAAAVSMLHDHLLASRMQALVREKIHHRIERHGVVLEIQGKGILLTGPSGVGKTSTALAAAKEGCIWVADDLAVIRKRADGALSISGHPKISEYYHTRETGIARMDGVLPGAQRKKRTLLYAVIEVIRTNAACRLFEFCETKVMDVRLPLIRACISHTGFFDNNLLTKSLNQLSEGV